MRLRLISMVDGHNINNGMPGHLTKMLQSLYLYIVHGKVTAYNHWLSFIPHYANNVYKPN